MFSFEFEFLLFKPRDTRVQEDCSSPRYKMEEDISVRAKEIEAKLKGGPAPDKKPKDLMRAIGMVITIIAFFNNYFTYKLYFFFCRKN